MTADPGLPPDSAGGDAQRVNRKAVYSVVCGFAAFGVLWAFPFGAFVLGVPAVTAGVHARREIALGHGSERGDTLAVAGITAGATTIALMVISVLLP
ncbi:hypothetical protein GCM10022234_34770 [Aeromicrobium panaciterrae]|uniref:DUF4190 domain-containing protein n=1 Tax=Aeromicrobium panaciterrae TaxID=363861 RepID=UPI0031DBA701